RGDLSTKQLMEIMEACQIIFEPEQGVSDPNIRWLWPYYEMEYNCGLADLNLTMSRMETLISEAIPDRYDDSGTYANVQLPIYYGRMIRNNIQLRDRHHLTFLDHAYRRMMNYILTYPQEKINGAFYYTLTLIVSDYYECDQVMSYKEVSTKMMRRFIGFEYIKSQKISSLLKCCCGYIFDCDERFFDDIPFIYEIKDREEKRKALISYNEDCGLYFDYGLLKMHIERTRFTRDFFEREYEIYKLHTLSAYIDLKERESTKIFADICLGHHRWYNGHDGYPDEYVRSDSPYRQMCDLLSVVIWLNSNYHGDIKECIERIGRYEGRRFSPLISDFFRDEKLQKELTAILDKDEEVYYRELFTQIK
ncbi:MAG: hypothetical protein IKF68_05870, partial [Erysipelotrichaceae bacterium]|nr:hypothetical protein [Erysipelotrichaceae bacterium]